MKQANNPQPNPPEHAEDIDNQAAAWFARLRADAVSPEDQAAFAQWRQTDPAHQQAFADMAALWGDPLLRQALKATPIPPPSPKDKAGQRRWYPVILLTCLAVLAFVCNGLALTS